jgi:hypothetical protein
VLLVALAVVAGTGLALLLGRRPGPVRWKWAAAGLAGVTAAATGSALVGGGIGTAVECLALGLLVLFATANRRHPGMVLVGAGLLANLVVISVNGGMPVRGLASGVSASQHHHGLSDRDRLRGLADVIRLGALGETVSAGDVTVALGGMLVAFHVFAPTAPRGRRRRADLEARSR